MAYSKQSKKAIWLILLVLGGIPAYFAYDYFNVPPVTSQTEKTDSIVEAAYKSDSPQEDTDQGESSVAEQEIAPEDSNQDEQLSSIEATIEEVGQQNSIAPKEEKHDEKLDVAEKTALVAQTGVTEEVESKATAQLVKTEEVQVTDMVEKVTRAEPLVDPFNMIIEVEAEDTKVLDKFDYGLYVNAFNEKNGKMVKGRIQVYDNVRSKKISAIETHTLSGINDPNNRNQSVRIISSVFGFKPQEIIFSLNEPDTYQTETPSTVSPVSEGVIRVDMALERLKVGDIAVMWQVFFFKDAAIMQARSKPELEDLYNMMKENPKMKIKIHGHTNGNSHGKIIHLGEGDNNDLFNIKSEKHVETVGSALKLSLYRAETIQHYLSSKGIDVSRIDIKGWGGKKMLYDKHSSQANLNVRVEVEILGN